MRVWHCLDSRQRNVIYVPNTFLGIERDYGVFNFDWNPDTLQGLALLISRKDITKEDLEKRGWIIQGIDMSNSIIKDFRKLCFKKTKDRKKHRKEIRKMAYEIIEFVCEIGAYESYSKRYPSEHPSEHLYDDGYFGMDTEEELDEDEWWKRDKQPPFLRDDIDWSEDNLD